MSVGGIHEGELSRSPCLNWTHLLKLSLGGGSRRVQLPRSLVIGVAVAASRSSSRLCAKEKKKVLKKRGGYSAGQHKTPVAQPADLGRGRRGRPDAVRLELAVQNTNGLKANLTRQARGADEAARRLADSRRRPKTGAPRDAHLPRVQRRSRTCSGACRPCFARPCSRPQGGLGDGATGRCWATKDTTRRLSHEAMAQRCTGDTAAASPAVARLRVPLTVAWSWCSSRRRPRFMS